MNKLTTILWSFIVLIATLYLIRLSVFLSPYIQGVNIENDFKNYYITNFSGKIDSQSDFKKKISIILNSIPRIRNNTNDSLKSRIWICMFSGNENIALTSGAIHFSYLIENDKTTNILTLILLCIFYSTSYLIVLSAIWHNVLTYVMRFETFPTKCYIRYYVQYTKDFSQNKNNILQADSIKEYWKIIFTNIPIWLIGFIIGFLNKDYNLYIESPVIPLYLFIFLFVYCVCVGSLLVVSLNQIILYFFMRINVDVVTTYVDDVICALLGIVVSKWIFNNGLGTTVAVTIVSLIYTIIQNNITRSVNAVDYEKTELNAIRYANLGFCYHKKRQILKAIDMFKQAICIYTHLDLIKETAPIYGSIGKAYFDNGNLDHAKEALNKAKNLYEKYQHDLLALKTTISLLNLLNERKQFSCVE